MGVTVAVGSSFLLLLGLLVAVMWGSRSIREPSMGLQETRAGIKRSALRRYFWWANVIAFSGLVSAVLVAWPGSRLAMRILAATSPESAQGRLTEAQAIVGFPSVEGTIALLVFGALPAGFLAALLFPLVRRWLPGGRLAGPLFGSLLFIWLGSVLDPLRADNIDFDIVGPGWLSVIVFAVLAPLHGAVVAAAAGWWSERLPLWSRTAAKYYVPLLVGSIVAPYFTVLVVIGFLLLMLWLSVVPASWLRPRFPQRAMARVGAGAMVLATAAALPVFIGAIVSIASRPI